MTTTLERPQTRSGFDSAASLLLFDALIQGNVARRGGGIWLSGIDAMANQTQIIDNRYFGDWLGMLDAGCCSVP